MNTDAPDRNKTELTQNVTRYAVIWLDAKGFKPVETEVSLGCWKSRTWIADVAGIITPTQTELINLKLLKHPPKWNYKKQSDTEYRKEHDKKHADWFAEYLRVAGTLTAHIEVKTSPADFRRDTKFALNGSPTNLKYIAMPRGMIDESKWPKGWGIMLYGVCKQLDLLTNRAGMTPYLQCVRPSPLYEVPIKEQLGTILAIAVRRDHVSRYERLRQFQREIRIEDGERKTMARISSAISFILRIAEGSSIEEAKLMCGIRQELPPYILEKIECFKGKIPK